MHVTLTRVSTTEPGEAAGIVGKEMERWLRDIEGFEGFLMLSRDGESVGVTFWKSREIAEQHRPLRMEFVNRVVSVAGATIDEIVDYDLTFARLGPLATDESPS